MHASEISSVVRALSAIVTTHSLDRRDHLDTTSAIGTPSTSGVALHISMNYNQDRLGVRPRTVFAGEGPFRELAGVVIYHFAVVATHEQSADIW